MGKTVMIVALTWSLMRASDTWFDDGSYIDAALFIALTVLIRIVLSPELARDSAAHEHEP
jgi:hypothetical protein